MLDATQQPAATYEQYSWLLHIIEFVSMVAMVVASFVTLRERTRDNTKDLGKLEQRMGQAEQTLEEHCADTTRHRDPERDEQRLKAIEGGVQEILRELRGPRGPRGDNWHGGKRT